MLGCSPLDFDLYIVIYDRKEEKMLPVIFAVYLSAFPSLNLNTSIPNSIGSSVPGSSLYCGGRTFLASAEALLEPSTEWSLGCHLF